MGIPWRTVLQALIDHKTETSVSAAECIKALIAERDCLLDKAAHGCSEFLCELCDAPRKTAREWAEELGGMDGLCGTNPEDCPLDIVTEKTFWRRYSNSASAG